MMPTLLARPKHVAIIMDGNRRWAREHGVPSIEGHRRGMIALREITRAACDFGIEILTVYGFSTENWRRDQKEIALLLDLCVYFVRSELDELVRNNVRVSVLGHYEALPSAAVRALDRLIARTANNTGVQLNLAVNYSARAEIDDAVNAIANDMRLGKITEASLDEAGVASYLTTASFPDPDMVIRPGGEARLSNFLLYQAAHAELYLTDVYWPGFTREHFAQALVEYDRRQCRKR